MESNDTNLAETLAREMKTPIEIAGDNYGHRRRIALPPGWNLIEKNDEAFSATPLRKCGKVCLTDAESFIDYMLRHTVALGTTVWCTADYKAGDVNFTGIINDHMADLNGQGWRDHIAKFKPVFSEEWSRWNANNKKQMTQTEFATFIEDNLQDISSGIDKPSPSGADMLAMALQFEANQDMKFKSHIRLQNGGVQMNFSQDDDAGTIAKMQMFDRFAIGITAFWGGAGFFIEARLRYRVKEGGKLVFWYELIRQDKTLEAATAETIKLIRDKTGLPFFFGDAFAS